MIRAAEVTTMTIADKLEVVHPYYPIGIALSGGTFTANDWDVLTLILAFAGGWAFIFGVTLVVSKRINPNLKGWDQALVLWFVLCKFCHDTLNTIWLQVAGSIHLFFEGYFVLNHTRMASMQDFFGQLWKEYALSDSRYLFSDPFVLCMETWTAVWLHPLTPFSVLTDSDHVGTSFSADCSPYYQGLSLSLSYPSPCLNRPVLWRSFVLRHQSIWRFLRWKSILSTWAILFLVLLYLHEFFVDIDSWVYVSPIVGVSSLLKLR